MIILIVLILFDVVIIDGIHFNGGTISWGPVNPYDNSSLVEITITQSYAWTYPNIICATDVPVSSPGRSSANASLICVVDCSTDGNYSAHQVDILTDCVSVSTALGIMTSQRAVNVLLGAGAHFYVSYVGSAWRVLGDPAVGGLQWSITSFIDLRMRPDGFINTPPVASVTSPQYAIVNRTTQIQIPVSDANAGDDVRCRWSTYTPGVKRRKRLIEEDYRNYRPVTTMHNSVATKEKLLRVKRKKPTPTPPTTPDPCLWCYSACWHDCPCTCSGCSGTTCANAKCSSGSGCPKTTTVSGATTVTTTIPTTTTETQGTVAPTTSYIQRQAIDECGGICYPSSVPTGTTLSNCTISFKGLKAGTWYGVSVQVNKDLVVSIN